MSGIVAFGVVYAITGSARGEQGHAVDGVFAGMLFGTITVGWDYWRLPRPHRLAPSHAIGLGLLNVLTLGWMVSTRDAPLEWRLGSWIAVGLGLVPATYLVSAALRQLFDESRTGITPRDGT